MKLETTRALQLEVKAVRWIDFVSRRRIDVSPFVVRCKTSLTITSRVSSAFVSIRNINTSSRNIVQKEVCRFVLLSPSSIDEERFRSSLQDILENEEIKLDTMFKHSIMHDIVKVGNEDSSRQRPEGPPSALGNATHPQQSNWVPWQFEKLQLHR